ncbi:DUF484 family protein [Ningiella sp. W23]|uniref:DUF484 family protein n=1 Tax=Ningiella sp. W23 TaxID=3023715 RepID=UPI0037581AD2
MTNNVSSETSQLAFDDMNEANSDEKRVNASKNKQTLANNSEVIAHDVAVYLQDHPDFFLSYPEVLAELHVHHTNKGVVSLTQLQSEQYRDKIKTLKKQQDKLIANAKRNELIYSTYAKLNLALIKCTDFSALENVLHEELCQSLGLSEAHIYPFSQNAGSVQSDNGRISEIQQRSLLDKKLNGKDFYFGRLGQNEKNVLFPDEVAESVALMTIGDDKPIALLAIASKDPLHFTPDMDTTLLSYLRDFLSFHLPKLL